MMPEFRVFAAPEGREEGSEAARSWTPTFSSARRCFAVEPSATARPKSARSSTTKRSSSPDARSRLKRAVLPIARPGFRWRMVTLPLSSFAPPSRRQEVTSSTPSGWPGRSWPACGVTTSVRSTSYSEMRSADKGTSARSSSTSRCAPSGLKASFRWRRTAAKHRERGRCLPLRFDRFVTREARSFPSGSRSTNGRPLEVHCLFLHASIATRTGQPARSGSPRQPHAAHPLGQREPRRDPARRLPRRGRAK